MKKVGFIIFIVALVAGVILANLSGFGRLGSSPFNVSFNFGKVSGSGNVITETRDVRDFSSIDVSGIFKVEATAQKDFRVEVQADDNLLPFITTEVRGGVLHIEAEKRLKSNGPIIIRVSAPDVEHVEASGVSNVSIKDLNSERFDADTSGKSHVSVQGMAENLDIDVSGASEVDAAELTSQNAKVDASGASKVTVNVSRQLDADASGASRIYYSGPAAVNKNTSGASSVTPK
jgi:Putative auto-transporter adhesin, head GIN domain